MDPQEIIEQPDPNLKIGIFDSQGNGGAHHVYRVWGTSGLVGQNFVAEIRFQDGGVVESGVNGLTNEALLEIVRHRLECFQRGPFPCSENAAALVAVNKALESLYARTAERRARGVEGVSVK